MAGLCEGGNEPSGFLKSHFPDLTTPDNALWGFIKDKVRNHRYSTKTQLRATVEDAFNEVTLDYLSKTSARTWRRIQLFCENEDLHTDILNR
ncbi:hypothetical protein ANN_25072 [Periplaneta americana]|uniref:Uncharacterized protein n=1 Tax=Periplaneta americana TaxID=6978 RepID=A0ABQ8S0E0_PERAM|nr:hypothetical protein ANN_25072 [Periplaneta americana]